MKEELITIAGYFVTAIFFLVSLVVVVNKVFQYIEYRYYS